MWKNNELAFSALLLLIYEYNFCTSGHKNTVYFAVFSGGSRILKGGFHYPGLQNALLSLAMYAQTPLLLALPFTYFRIVLIMIVFLPALTHRKGVATGHN